MKKILHILSYVYAVISGLRVFYLTAANLFFIGMLAEVQDNTFATDSVRQQTIFLNIGTLALVFCICYEFIDIILRKYVRKSKLFIITKCVSIFICYEIYCMYGKSVQTPYSMLNLKGILFLTIGIAFLEFLLGRITERIDAKN